MYSFPWQGLILNYVQIHALVAQGSTILAEHQAGKRDFSQGLMPSPPPVAPHLIFYRFSHADNPIKDTTK
jgi:hypothetical protein